MYSFGGIYILIFSYIFDRNRNLTAISDSCHNVIFQSKLFTGLTAVQFIELTMMVQKSLPSSLTLWHLQSET